MKRVLFVDDEPNILDALRDLLRRYRKEWEMVFALGGQAALAALERERFDAVVTDMRMPVIDGAALLTQVRDRYPATARIVLSGHAERESVVRALPVAHQFLSKPCDAGALRLVVERACELQRLLHDERIRAAIGALDRLPSAPGAYWELTRAAARSDVTLIDLTAIVERDPAMVVKLLQLVNSAYFGIARRVSTVAQAVSYLGTDLLKALALSIHAFGTMAVEGVPGFSVEGLQRHSLQAAQLCRRASSDPKRAAEAFTAALVHDVGKLVLAMASPERFTEVVAQEAATGREDVEHERAVLGVTHAEVGGYLLGVWGLPLSIVEGVVYHHQPSLFGGEELEGLALVHMACTLAQPASVHSDEGLDLPFLERAGYAARVPELRAAVAQLAAEAGR